MALVAGAPHIQLFAHLVSGPEQGQGEKELERPVAKVEGNTGLLLFQLGLEDMNIMLYLMYFYGRPG